MSCLWNFPSAKYTSTKCLIYEIYYLRNIHLWNVLSTKSIEMSYSRNIHLWNVLSTKYPSTKYIHPWNVLSTKYPSMKCPSTKYIHLWNVLSTKYPSMKCPIYKMPIYEMVQQSLLLHFLKENCGPDTCWKLNGRKFTVWCLISKLIELQCCPIFEFQNYWVLGGGGGRREIKIRVVSHTWKNVGCIWLIDWLSFISLCLITGTLNLGCISEKGTPFCHFIWFLEWSTHNLKEAVYIGILFHWLLS